MGKFGQKWKKLLQSREERKHYIIVMDGTNRETLRKISKLITDVYGDKIINNSIVATSIDENNLSMYVMKYCTKAVDHGAAIDYVMDAIGQLKLSHDLDIYYPGLCVMDIDMEASEITI